MYKINNKNNITMLKIYNNISSVNNNFFIKIVNNLKEFFNFEEFKSSLILEKELTKVLFKIKYNYQINNYTNNKRNIDDNYDYIDNIKKKSKISNNFLIIENNHNKYTYYDDSMNILNENFKKPNKNIIFNNNDNQLCSFCKNGDLQSVEYYISYLNIDPFKYNSLYKMNPIGLAYENNHSDIIELIKKYVSEKKIHYDNNFYSPN